MNAKALVSGNPGILGFNLSPESQDGWEQSGSSGPTSCSSRAIQCLHHPHIPPWNSLLELHVPPVLRSPDLDTALQMFLLAKLCLLLLEMCPDFFFPEELLLIPLDWLCEGLSLLFFFHKRNNLLQNESGHGE
ncbi:hypothetical protein BTVI_19387 [Pitangus sulphuratus]|nr:hypothetical protein BTVI_19387 [Pitangus sulphuratus]